MKKKTTQTLELKLQRRNFQFWHKQIVQ